jgi:hypothetical protein
MSKTDTRIRKKVHPAILDSHVHEYIAKLTGKYLAESGKRLTVSQVLEKALNIPSPQMQSAS